MVEVAVVKDFRIMIFEVSVNLNDGGDWLMIALLNETIVTGLSLLNTVYCNNRFLQNLSNLY